MRNVPPDPRLSRDVAEDQFRLQLWQVLRELGESINDGSDGKFHKHVSKTGTYSASVNDHTIFVAPSGTCTITLPAPAEMIGKEVVVKRSNNTTHVVTIQGASGTVDGAASVTLTTAWQVRRFRTDGSNWFTT